MKKSDIADPAYSKAIIDAFEAGKLSEHKRIISIIEDMEKQTIFNSLGSCVWTQNIIKAINDDVE